MYVSMSKVLLRTISLFLGRDNICDGDTALRRTLNAEG